MLWPRITRLRTLFIICYLCIIILPVSLFTFIIYYYQNSYIYKNYLDLKKESLIYTQNFLNDRLRQMGSYHNQLTSCIGISDIIEGFSTSERAIVYSYQSSVIPELNSIRNYDDNIDSIAIYTANYNASKILEDFIPIDEFYILNKLDKSSVKVMQSLNNTFWELRNNNGTLETTFYAGFIFSSLSRVSGILEINCNDSLFRSLSEKTPSASTYIFYNDELIYNYNDSAKIVELLEKYQKTFLPSITDTQIEYIENNRFLISGMALNQSNIKIVQISPLSPTELSFAPLIINIILSLVILIVTSIAIFKTIYKLFSNISSFSRHLTQTHNHQPKVYTGNITKDEFGDLINDYNLMVTRTNVISDDLHLSEIQLRNAQIEALQAQLNPHFFYGTLEAIHMIAESNNQPLISEITVSFGNLMRYTLSREYLVPVTREISIVSEYLNIQSKRLKNRFTIMWDICHLDNKWRCPKFILFSLVENVFSHVIGKTRRLINIKITVRFIDDDFVISVENDGSGIPEERLREIKYFMTHPEERINMKSVNNGRGVFNIYDRLKLFYEENFELTIESVPNTRTVSKIRIRKYKTLAKSSEANIKSAQSPD